MSKKKLSLFVDRAKHTLPARQKVVFDIEVDLDTRDLSWEEKAEVANAILESRYKKRTFAKFTGEDFKETLDFIKKRRDVRKAMNVALAEEIEGDVIEKFIEKASNMDELTEDDINKFNKTLNVLGRYKMEYLKAKDYNRRYNYQKKKEKEGPKETIKDPATGKVIDVTPEE